MRKNKAFTLAEVLITLTIIGIIAAITIPNLIQSWKKLQVEVGLKQAYSIIQSIIQRSEAETDSGETWDWSNDANIITYHILPYIPQYTRLHNEVLLGYNHDNIYNKYYKNNIANIKHLNGNKITGNTPIVMRGQLLLTLKNGMDLMIRKGHMGGDMWGIQFFVDINGLNKGNNTVGKEIFLFEYTVKSTCCCSQNCLRQDVRALLVPGFDRDITLAQALSANTVGGCNLKSGSYQHRPVGALCSYVIFKNGWKIPDNYPVKRW